MIENTAERLEPGKVRFAPDSEIGRRYQTFFQERIFSDSAKDVVYAEALSAYTDPRDDEAGPLMGIWQGEFWGKWMLSAIRVCRYTGDAGLKAFLQNAAHSLMACQREDGYIGSYRDSRNFFAPKKADVKAALGHETCWNWNIWCRKYTLWGLLECADLTGDDAILQAARRMADQLLGELEATGTDIADTGTFHGMPSCSILKPMLLLYRKTGEKRWLDFCLGIASGWEREDGRCPNLISNALSGVRIADWYPELNGHWAKVYEMLSCFDGLCELYRVTGTRRYLDACEAFWDMLVEYEQNRLYSVGVNDQFGDGARLLNSLTEPCDVIHFMRLSYELFTLTGKAAYMDMFEKSFYNPMLAAPTSDGKWGSRALRSQGMHYYVTVQAKFTHNHCCVDNMPRGFMNAVDASVMKRGGALVFNLYNDLEGSDGDTAFSVTGGYPANLTVRIALNVGGKGRKVMLRIPAWSRRTVVRYQGQAYLPEAGYFTLDIPHGAAVLTVEFDGSLRMRTATERLDLTDTDWRAVRWKLRELEDSDMVHGTRVLLDVGPLLLAQSVRVDSAEADMFGDGALRLTADTPVSLDKAEAPAGVLAAYTLRAGDREYPVCDYSSAGLGDKTGSKHLFSIFF